MGAGLFDEIAGGVMLAGGTVLTATGVGAGIGVPLAAVGGTVLAAGINKDNQARTNAYNSPQAQMARYSAAGLNPNLIYQQSGYTAPPLPSANIEVPHLYTKYELKQQKATYDNTQEMIKTAHTSRALQMAQTDKTANEATDAGIKVNRDTDTFGADVTQAQLRNQRDVADIAKTQADTQFTIDANQRAALLNPVTLAKGIADIALTKQHTLNAQQINDINKFSQSMSNSGIDSSSPAWLKIVMSYIAHTFGPVTNIIKPR